MNTNHHLLTHNQQFLSRFINQERLAKLTDEEINELIRLSEQDDVYARYGYARWLYFKNPHKGAISVAELLLLGIKDQLPDALAAYAMMLRYGEAELSHPAGMDIEAFRLILGQALKQGSLLAALQNARARIFGTFCDAEPQAVADEIKQHLSESPDSDPQWFILLAFAYEEMDRVDDAISQYERAIEMGENAAYYYLAVIYYLRGNIALYEEYMEEGCAKGCTLCMIYQSDMDEELFASLDDDDRECIHQDIDERLKKGLKLGDGTCGYYLWHHYNYGMLGYEQDNLMAMVYLQEGARLANPSCIMQMAIEAEAGTLPLSPTECAELWLKAARYMPHDTDVLRGLQRADDDAFLLKHKDELEKYWYPLFETLTDEDDYEEDDGRNDPYV